MEVGIEVNAELVYTAGTSVVRGKGLLAMDESNATCGRRRGCDGPGGMAPREDNRGPGPTAGTASGVRPSRPARARWHAVIAVDDATVRSLLPAVPGIAFLSGGQSGELTPGRLGCMNARVRLPSARLPWPLAFSFACAIQQSALQTWRGEAVNLASARKALSHRARCNHAALSGEYDAAMENREPDTRIRPLRTAAA